jgi:hypothetical protein
MNKLISTLQNLKNLGFNPKNILDVGAYKGEWTNNVKSSVFPDSSFVLIDSIPYEELNGFNHSIATLADCVKEVKWYQKMNTGDSVYKERTFVYNDSEFILKTTTTLDLLFDDTVIFDLIKIDAQGSEIPILMGGPRLVSKAELIVLELPFAGQYNEGAPSFIDSIKYMDSIGFDPFDVVEDHYNKDILTQVDILFAKRNGSALKYAQEVIASIGL